MVGPLATIATRRYGRMLGILALLLFACSVHAATALTGAAREVMPGDTPQSVLDAYHRGEFASFDPNLLQRFSRRGLGTWVVLQPQPPLVSEERVLSVYPPPMAPVTLFNTDGSTLTMSLDDFLASAHGNGRLAYRITADMPASAPILLKIEPGTVNHAVASFHLQPWNEYLQTDAQWLAFASACFAVMVAMSLMALCLALMLRDSTFAWYAGYVLCYALIQGMQTGYLFHPLELTWLAGAAPMIASSAMALSLAFAAMFVSRFCELPRYAAILQTPTVALAVGMPLVVLLDNSQVAVLQQTAQVLVTPLLVIGTLLLLSATVVAAIQGSRPAWFFLVGWTPLLALTALYSSQMTGVLSDIPWLGDACLAAGAFEAIVLSLGLADRALMMRRDRHMVQELADNDALTNVLNRRAWTESMQKVLGNCGAQPIALLFLDLDHFKMLNDRQGHAAGDRALVAVADALRSELRPHDLLGRYGGEEFVAMLFGVEQNQAMQVATRLCRRVYRLEIPVNQTGLVLSVSIGIAMRTHEDTVDTLVERSDLAMYRAKLAGRNRARLDEKLEGVRRSWPRAVENDRSA
ncbi:GGDEF domain-containing protein [Dyella japonica]|uniref:diguanylate cyclase n=1 Tax=Dyella japonica DSM 16301 TaxID=1440762 RepID=A0A0G9H7S2_9GAMM|nr:diguanylate cyclase [Dyella japonica]KLD65855.1 diguanylate cyclase [Dyella japonica DSM 16301]